MSWLFTYALASEIALGLSFIQIYKLSKMFSRERTKKLIKKLDYEKREKEREIAQRKQEFVLDLKKNFDDQIKIYNETLDKDRLRPVGQVRYRRESARYKRWKEQQKNGQSNEVSSSFFSATPL